MLKITLYLIVLVAIIIAAASGYHLYKVNAKNKLEMKNFESEVKLDANLGKTLVVYYSLSGHTI